MITNQTFSAALEACKNGHRITREGWNGKGMFVFLQRGSRRVGASDEGPEEAWPSTIDGVPAELFDTGYFGSVTRLPNLAMRSATGSIVTGWLASQTDMLASDWCILTSRQPPLSQ